MKALKTIGIILLILVVTAVVIGFVQPNDYMVERSTVIDASKEQVYPHIKYWKNWDAWSPWAEKDSTIEVTIEGEDGEENSMYSWTSTNSGAGNMTNTGSTENEEFNYDLVFTAPRQGSSKGYVKLEDGEEGGTKVSWAFYGEHGFMGRIMSIFFDMDAMVGPDFERGLELMKKVVETQVVSEEEEKLTIEELTYEATTYVGLTFENIAFEDLMSPDFYGTNIPKVFGHVMEKQYEIAGPPTSLYHTWDTANKQSTMSVVVPVNGEVTEEGDFKRIVVETSAMAVYNHYGDYSMLGHAHTALEKYFQENSLEYKFPVMEQYVSDPAEVADTTQWLTKVIYLHD
jgi:effector-binding domain-containing protein